LANIIDPEQTDVVSCVVASIFFIHSKVFSSLITSINEIVEPGIIKISALLISLSF